MVAGGERRTWGPRSGSRPKRPGPLVVGGLLAVTLAPAPPVRAADPPLAPGEIVIADRGGQGVRGALYRFEIGAVPRAIVTSEPLVMPTAVAVDRDGTLVVADLRWNEPGRIVRVDPTSGVVTTVVDGWPLLTPIGLALEPAGDVLVADLDAGSRLDFPRGSLAGTGALYRIPRATGLAEVLAMDCCPWNASAVATTPTGELAVVDLGFQVFAGDGALVLVDAATGVQRPIATSTPLLDPSGVVVEATGTILVTEAANPQIGNAAVLAIEPRSGTVTTIATGAPISDPRGLAMTASHDLVVADSAARAVYRIAVPDRSLDVLATTPLMTPWGIAVAP